MLSAVSSFCVLQAARALPTLAKEHLAVLLPWYGLSTLGSPPLLQHLQDLEGHWGVSPAKSLFSSGVQQWCSDAALTRLESALPGSPAQVIVVDVEDRDDSMWHNLTPLDGGLSGWRLLWDRWCPIPALRCEPTFNATLNPFATLNPKP